MYLSSKIHTGAILLTCMIAFCGVPKKSFAQKRRSNSTNMMGVLGLNTIPTARMDEKGTARMSISTLDPYLHASMGFQVADPLYVNVRQSGEVSSLRYYSDRIYSGMDFKLRLFEESDKRPEIAFGVNSAFGNKRLASEYFSFSKRYYNFDFTGGLAWGKLGSAGHLSNPLKSISSHFGEDRDEFSENAQNLDNWFTGKDIGFFGGVEYFTPIKGLSIKAEYGGDDFSLEEASADFDAPSPWSLGLNYQPIKNVDIAVGTVGAQKLMGRVSIQGGLHNWIGKNREFVEPEALTIPLPTENSESVFKKSIINQKLQMVNVDKSEESASAQINLSPNAPAALQIGHALRRLSNTTNQDVENYTIALKHRGLRGPDIKIIRGDFKNAVLGTHGSSEEIWRDAIIEDDNLIKTSSFHDLKPLDVRFILDTHLSLNEDDISPLYRTSAIIETTQELPFGLLSGFSGRINLKDNIEDLTLLRGLANFVYGVNNPVGRGNVETFTRNTINIEHSYLSWLKSINANTHFALTGGLLEEMYGGIGGEILYRPFGKTFAIGADIWRAYPRDPDSSFAGDVLPDPRTTGHVNLFYEVPDKNTTFYARLGRYLGEDVGATLGVKTGFKNGVSIDAFLTGTNETDVDIFGGTTNLYSGVRVNMPIGNIPLMPDGSAIQMRLEQMGRDTGQALDKPVDLYELTEPMSYRQLSQNWLGLVQ